MIYTTELQQRHSSLAQWQPFIDLIFNACDTNPTNSTIAVVLLHINYYTDQWYTYVVIMRTVISAFF